MASHPDDFEPGTPEARVRDATLFSQLMYLSVLLDLTEPGEGNRPGLPNNVLVEIYEKATLGVYDAPIAVVMSSLGHFVTTELVDLVSGTVLQRFGVHAAPGERLKRITAVPGYPISLEEVVTYRGNTVTSAVGRAIDFQCPRKNDRAKVLWDVVPEEVDRDPWSEISVAGPRVHLDIRRGNHADIRPRIHIRGEPIPLSMEGMVIFYRNLDHGVSTWATLHGQLAERGTVISETSNLKARYNIPRGEIIIGPLYGPPHPAEYRMGADTILAELPPAVRANMPFNGILKLENGHVAVQYGTLGMNTFGQPKVYCSVPIRAFIRQQPSQAPKAFDGPLLWIRTREYLLIRSIGSLGEMLLERMPLAAPWDLVLIMTDGFTFALVRLLEELGFNHWMDFSSARICGGFLAVWSQRRDAAFENSNTYQIHLFKPRRVPVYGDDGKEIELQRLAEDATTILHDRGLALVPAGRGHTFSSMNYPAVWLGSAHTVLRSPPPRIPNPFAASEPAPSTSDRTTPTQTFPLVTGDWTAVNCVTEEECESLRPCQCCGVGFGVLRCSRCHGAHYCSPECATLDWPLHRDKCVAERL